MRTSLIVCLGVSVCPVLLALGCRSEMAESGKDSAPAKKVFECRWAVGKIKIDGKIDEVAWDKAQVIDGFQVFWQSRKPRTATKARLIWDDSYLYFAADMEDTDLYADITERNGMTWYNDVFELFFKPSAEKLPYYEFQVNAANTPLEIYFPSRGSGGYRRFAPLTRLGMESEVKLRGTLNDFRDKDDGWTVEGRIPWTGFKETGGKPSAGDLWLFSLCRYDYSTAFEHPELSSTSPVLGGDFHRYEDYNSLKFIGPEK
ncbi:MAG: carbohydrate-binding family 9-like protein [Gemmataceae bacterium]